MWNHFTIVEGDEKKAKCQYCGVLIKYSNGTSTMRTHLGRCTVYDNDKTQPNKRRKTTSDGKVVCSPSYSKFDQEDCRALLVKTFVCAELPFCFVENEMFRKLLITLQPRFSIPSWSTLRRDIWALYLEEKEKLKKLLPNCGRVYLATDSWTSTQNLSYMSLTVHFVDSEWNMHKKIINFCQITGHSGHMIGKYIDDYLRSWGLSQVLTITVDNALANTCMINYLSIRMGSWNNLVLNGEFVHMRCCTNILNLIVKSGLKEDKSCIKKICHAVKYVKSSPSRLAKFMEYAVKEKVTYKGVVILDVETRWNSTYLMLKAALQYQKSFDFASLA
ncbi:zinc finger BED domain-containing protein RICESLEEPER 2-like [Vicia villosa]|uniref:zinc finger BED domain-containing protein RICESLEEPER 2-like n=1 Tax=Vicia villosa TaxID=3911 RepID=UPI00273B4EBC|nr:zinc finger BED domain-containing protein RICESLEEPER 2-like [Vicia villosa]